MAEKINVDHVVISMMERLVDVINEQKRMDDVQQVLYMCLAGYEIYEEETALSVDIDCTQEYLRQYLIQMKLNGCTDGSIRAYHADLRNMLDYINKNIKDIRYADLRNWLAYGKMVRGWKDRTYNTKLIIARSFFGWLYEEDMLPENPAKKLKETKIERRIGTVLQPEEREELRCACDSERELALCDMLYSTGARISELCALNISDIDFVRMTAVVYGKGRKEREIYFNAPAKVHLERYLKSRIDDNPALFVMSRKPYNRMSPESARIALKKIQARDSNISDIRLTPHVFRRTVGTEMINKGAPLELVAEKLGHVQLDTTKQCYASISRATVQQAHNRYVG